MIMRRTIHLALLAGLSASSVSAFELKSPDVLNGAAFAPEQVYTRCGGKNVAPGLTWSGAPVKTKSFVLTFVDTSVLPSGWSHWIVVNLPAGTKSLPKGGALPHGAEAIQSNFGDLTYAGPCPPAGTGVHIYEFTIYALDRAAPAIVENASANELNKALSAMALAKATMRASAVTP